MSTIKLSNERTTIYLDPRVKKTAQYYALRDDKSLSEVVNEQLFEYLENMADIAALEEASNDGQEFVPIEQFVEELGFDINEIRRQAQTEHKKTAKKTR